MNKIETGICVVLGVLCTLSQEPNYTLPPITYMTPESARQRDRQRGHSLMTLKGFPDGDMTLICTNWVCPTSIVVNAVKYDVITNMWRNAIEFDIATTNMPPQKIASGYIKTEENGQEARLSAFVTISYTSMALHLYAEGILAQPIDPVTNMLFMTDVDCDPDSIHQLVYKNIRIRYEVTNDASNSVATNAFAFTAALINEGLPETERIPLPPAP